MEDPSRRKFIKDLSAAAVAAILGSNNFCCSSKSNPFSPDNSIAPSNSTNDLTNGKLYITSAAWVPESIEAAQHKERYDAANIPAIQINADGTLNPNQWSLSSKVEEMPNFLIIQNYDGNQWNQQLTEKLMSLEDSQLRDELAKIEANGGYGILLDLESLTKDQQARFPDFVSRVKKQSGKPLIVASHAFIDAGGTRYGLTTDMDYKAVASECDALNYMTLDENPGNSNVGIFGLDIYGSAMSALIETDGVPAKKVLPTLATYAKIAHKDGSVTMDFDMKGIRKGYALNRLNAGEGIFEGTDKQTGEKVTIYGMDIDSAKARMDINKGFGINSVILWYGGSLVTDNPDVRAKLTGGEQPLGKMFSDMFGFSKGRGNFSPYAGIIPRFSNAYNKHGMRGIPKF